MSNVDLISIEKLLKNLCVISRVPEHGKLAINPQGDLEVDEYSRIVQSLKRWVLGNDRSRTIRALQELYTQLALHVTNILDSSCLNVIAHKDTITEQEHENYQTKFTQLQRIYSAMRDSLGGLANLRKTYAQSHVDVDLEIQEKQVKKECDKIHMTLDKLQQRARVVTVVDRFHLRTTKIPPMASSSAIPIAPPSSSPIVSEHTCGVKK